MSDQPDNLPSRPAREVRVVSDESSLAYLFDTARFEHLYRIATAMAKAALIPDHLVGKKVDGKWRDYTDDQIVGNCFLVVNQAVRWGIDPFAAMAETYEVGGKLAYQGKLIAAVVNARAGLKENLKVYYNSATGDALEATVVGTIQGEDQPREITLTVGAARTKNEMWTKDPKQKLWYSAALKWARRHTPEIILGVLSDDDDAERIVESMAAQHGFPPEAQPRTIEGLTAKLTQQTVANPIPTQTASPASVERVEAQARQAAKAVPDITPEMATIAKENAAKQATKRDEQPEPSIATDIANTLAMLVETGEPDKINRARKIFDAATGPEATLDDEGIDLVRGVWKQLQTKITDATSKKK